MRVMHPSSAAAKQELPDDATQRVWFAQAARGVAVGLVVWFHLGESFLLNAPVIRRFALLPAVERLPRPGYLAVAEWLRGAHINFGLLGVALFFLTSGFVIPFSLRRRSLRGFVTRRVLRLYPVYWLSLILLCALLRWRAGELGIAFPYNAAVLATNGFLAHPYFGHPSVDAANWTLAIEELFYICAAIVARRGLLADRRIAILIAGGATVLNCMYRQTAGIAPGLATPIYGLMFNSTYLILILVGFVLYQRFDGFCSARQCAATISALGGMFVVSVYSGPLGSIALDVILNCSVALALFLAAYRWRSRLPKVALLDGLANISYPLYMFHGLAGYILLDLLLNITGRFPVALAGTLVIVFSLATATHVYFEKPINNWGRRLARRWDRPATVLETGAETVLPRSAST
jgi:peptidoglycan/LPS O-acetylase OafA/YrhL